MAEKPTQNHVEFSVVVPVKDEVSNISDLVQELEQVMAPLSQNWELLIIDDGSTDGSTELLKQLSSVKPFLSPIYFERNYGQSSAMDAGFRAAQGRWVISLDGDGQNDPHDIPKLLSFRDQADLICGKRFQRQDSWCKRWTSRIANGIRSRICRDGVSDTGCSLKLYRTECLRQIKLFKGLHRFLPALFVIEGFRVTEVPVHHRPRQKGKSKYSLRNRNINTFFDLLAVLWMRKRSLSYSFREPLL